MALLRRYGSPGFFDSGLQLICIFWSLVSHFPSVHFIYVLKKNADRDILLLKQEENNTQP